MNKSAQLYAASRYYRDIRLLVFASSFPEPVFILGDWKTDHVWYCYLNYFWYPYLCTQARLIFMDHLDMYLEAYNYEALTICNNDLFVSSEEAQYYGALGYTITNGKALHPLSRVEMQDLLHMITVTHFINNLSADSYS